MVLADCRREEGTNNYRMLSVCDDIEDLLNQLAAIIITVPEDVIMKQPEVFLAHLSTKCSSELL